MYSISVYPSSNSFIYEGVGMDQAISTSAPLVNENAQERERDGQETVADE
jgi:hypothetical protein